MQDALVNEYLRRMDGYSKWTTIQTNIVREIVRQFLVGAVNVHKANPGKLYKHLRTEQTNSAGRDPYTNEVVDTEYTTYSSDTYASGVDLYAQIMELSQDTEELEYPQGVQEDKVLTAALVCAPLIESGDLWRDDITDEIYYLRPVKLIAEVQSIPVIAQVRLFRLSETHPQYDLT